MRILENKEKLHELIVYGIFGVLATIVSFGSLYVLGKVFVNTDKNILNIVSIILAMTFPTPFHPPVSKASSIACFNSVTLYPTLALPDILHKAMSLRTCEPSTFNSKAI